MARKVPYSLIRLSPRFQNIEMTRPAAIKTNMPTMIQPQPCRKAAAFIRTAIFFMIENA
jgi:hypothetical protein